MQNMEFKLTSSWNGNLLVIMISGICSKKVSKEIYQRVFKLYGEEKPERVLINCTELEGRSSIIDTYCNVREFGSIKNYPKKVAFLDKPENQSFLTFYETTAINAGFPVTCFTDFDKAMYWLGKESLSTPVFQPNVLSLIVEKKRNMNRACLQPLDER